VTTKKPPRNRPSLPANRAFVVQLHAEAHVEHGEFRGRVEHLVCCWASTQTSSGKGR
jgi:hypothetical protein